MNCTLDPIHSSREPQGSPRETAELYHLYHRHLCFCSWLIPQIFQSFITLLISHTPAVPNFIWGTMLGGLNMTSLDLRLLLLKAVKLDFSKAWCETCCLTQTIHHLRNPGQPIPLNKHMSGSHLYPVSGDLKTKSFPHFFRWTRSLLNLCSEKPFLSAAASPPFHRLLNVIS